MEGCTFKDCKEEIKRVKEDKPDNPVVRVLKDIYRLLLRRSSVAVNYRFEVIIKASTFTEPEGAAAITFVNQGDEAVTLNNALTLAVDSSAFTFDTDSNETDFTKYQIQFDGLGSNPKLVAIIKTRS